MGHNGKDEIMASAMVEIKIKTLDSQTYTLRVDKCVPVPALKEQVASVTGVVTEQQRLICRGKVLKDDQLLSAYHVEDGHTLHLVVRQPIPPLSESSTSNAAGDPASGAGDNQGSQRSRVVVGSFNIAEQGGEYSDLGQIVSAVLGSLGISGMEGGLEGMDAMAPLHERLSRSSGLNTARDSSATPIAMEQTSSQPAAIPDSLTTVSEYLDHLRQGFAAIGSNANNNVQASENSAGSVQDSGSTGGESRIPRPSHLAEVLRSARQLLTAEVADCLSNISTQLDDHVNVTDPSTRRLCQSNMLQAGALFENLGITLLEIGRDIMMARLGQTPDDAVVSSGPAVFITPTGRNPLPSRASRLGTGVGGLQAGTGHSSPFAGQSLASAPRNIEIRIRTGSWVPSSETNQREESTTQQQTTEQAIPSAPSGVTDSSVPSTRAPSDPQRNPVAFVIPVVARYQQVSSGEHSSTGLDGVVHQPAADSSRQPQSTGDNSSASGGRGLSDLRSRIHQLLRPLSRREQTQAGTTESQVAANPSTTETNEAQVEQPPQPQPASGTDEGNFLSSVLQQIMPFISQNVPSSSSDDAARQAGSSREEEESAERGDSSRRHEPPSPPESKRQKRE